MTKVKVLPSLGQQRLDPFLMSQKNKAEFCRSYVRKDHFFPRLSKDALASPIILITMFTAPGAKCG